MSQSLVCVPPLESTATERKRAEYSVGNTGGVGTAAAADAAAAENRVQVRAALM
jgi:hypothetical protein